MLHSLYRSLALLILLGLILMPPALAEQHSHVLVLNSYHQGMDWTDGELSGVRSVLEKASQPTQIHVEYMDTKRVADRAHFDNLRRLYSHKYQTLKFRAIVATDNDAFDFLQQYRDELFPGVPVIFCGVNWFRDELLAGMDGFTGIAETVDSAATVQLMLQLHPDTRRIVVVIDSTTTGNALREELEPVVLAFRERLAFEFWNKQTLAELPQKLAALPAD